MSWLLLVVGVVAVASVAVFQLMRALRFDLDSDLDLDLGDVFAPEAREFPQTGSMPMSTRLQQTVYRLHPSQHLHPGRTFPRTFEDGPWKWDESPAGLLWFLRALVHEETGGNEFTD